MSIDKKSKYCSATKHEKVEDWGIYYPRKIPIDTIAMRKNAIGWSKIKPDYPCVFIAKTINKYGNSYAKLEIAKKVRGKGLVLKDCNYTSFKLDKFKADEYLLIEVYNGEL